MNSHRRLAVAALAALLTPAAAMAQPKFCASCGAKIEPGAKFCPGCGGKA